MTDKRDPAIDVADEIENMICEMQQLGEYDDQPTQAEREERILAIIREAYAEQQKEIATLRAAIATPEVYAGVITKVVEDERDEALSELINCRRQLAENAKKQK